MKVVLILFAVSVLAAFAAVTANGASTAHAQSSLPPPTNITAQDTGKPGEVQITWDPVPGAQFYRIGWVTRDDATATVAAGHDWQEAFAFVDIANQGLSVTARGQNRYIISRLSPGVEYAFIVASNGTQYGEPSWPPPSGWSFLTLREDPNPQSTVGAASVDLAWERIPGAGYYRIGWVARVDVDALRATGRHWLEAFAFSDIANRGQTAYTVGRLTPGLEYAFLVAGNRTRYGEPQWPPPSAWQFITPVAAQERDLGPELMANPTQTFPASAAGGDYDYDDDRLVEVRTLDQLNAIRLDLRGGARPDNAHILEYLAAFPGALDDMGCPAGGCRGYELAANLDFDTNGNGRADAGDAYWNRGAGWDPIRSDSLYEGYGGTFDGNGYRIAHLYINRPEAHHPVGLFGRNVGNIRNVILSRADVTGLSEVGALVGHASIFDFPSQTSGNRISGRVSGHDRVGGLVGDVLNNGRVSDNIASATVSGNNHVGGLVGQNLGGGGAITDSTASGDVFGNDYVGGLVGENHGHGKIINSHAEGNVTGRFRVGGLAGLFNGGVIQDSTASGDVAGIRDLGALVGRHDAGEIINSVGTGTVTRIQ